MANHKRKKVKRYRRSFYTGAEKIKLVASIAALLVVVLAVAWFAAPHVLDWATHTWYTVVKGRDLEQEAASSEPASSSVAEDPDISLPVEEDPQPEPLDGKALNAGNWAVLDRSQLTSESSITAAAQDLAQQGIAYALITFKEASGNIYYASRVANAADSIAADAVDAQRIAAILRQEGIVPVAQICAFQDPVAAYTDRSMAIHYSADMLWLDNVSAEAGGKPWLNPYSSSAVQFVGDLIEELRDLGYEQIVLTGVQFPKYISAKQDFGTTNGNGRAAQLQADIAAWSERFGDSVVLWLSYTAQQCTAASKALEVPAVQLGMSNLLVTAEEGLDLSTRSELEQAAAAAGVAQLVICDNTSSFH